MNQDLQPSTPAASPPVPEFAEFEDAVASWVQDAGGTEPVNIWITPKASVSIKLPRNRPPRILVGRLLKDAETGQYFSSR